MASWQSEFGENDVRDLWENPPDIDMELDSRTLVYLDQNAWGCLLDGLQDKNSEYRNAYEVVKRSTEELNYIYPYSLANLMETGAHMDEKFRKNMYELVFGFSCNYSLRNALEVQQQELYAYVFSKAPYLWDIDVQKEAVGKGAIYPHGDFRLKPEEWISKEERDRIHRILQSDELNKHIFDSDEMVGNITKKHPHEEQRHVENLEDIREGITPVGAEGSEQERVDHIISSFKSENLFNLIQIAEFFGSDIGGYIEEDIALGGMLCFYAHFPAFYTYAHLSLGRLSHTQREVEYNDLADIMSLSVATPYCDIVVTEQFFGGMLHKYNLNELYGSDVNFDIRQLANEIEKELGESV
jgi:hypothetical protein